MKNTLAAFILIASFSIKAQAMIDNSCFVWLQQPDGKVKKNSVPRQAYVRISKDVNAAFRAKYFAGDEPVEAAFVIEDAHTKERQIFFSTITEKWSWKFDVQTRYGLAHMECD